MRRVLAVDSQYNRGPWFDSLRLDPFLTNVVSERDLNKHQKLRSVLSHGVMLTQIFIALYANISKLSGKNIGDIESVINENLECHLQTIHNRIAAGGNNITEVNFSEFIPLLTLDIMAHLCLGAQLERNGKHDDSHDFLDALSFGMRFQPYIAMIPEASKCLMWLGKFPWLRKRLFPTESSDNGIGRVMFVSFIAKTWVSNLWLIIEKHQKVRETLKTRPSQRQDYMRINDMLDSFRSRGLSDDQCPSELVIVMYV